MRASVARRDEGETIVLGSTVNRVIVGGDDTGGRSSVMESVLDPNWAGLPLHYHAAVDHLFVVLSGAVQITMDDTRYALVTGDVAWIPRGVTHELATGEQPCSLLRVDTPQPLDGCVRDLAAAYGRGPAVDTAVADSVMARYDTHRVTEGSGSVVAGSP